ncbi:MAG: hypothetical protein DRR19_27190 [Candidatus Parabeggiatoa sp. nov. 1]|nr:MAG: hypothetical protein DRR19_27190 [Gammaproteobacteria bacterium]
MTTENPYQPPTAKLHEDIIATGEAGGTLTDGIEGNYDFEIMEVIKEAWQKTTGFKGTLLAAGFIIFLVFFALNIALTFIISSLSLEENIAAVLINQLILTAVIYPFMAGIMMLGVRRAVDLPVSFSMAFGYFGYTVSLVIAALIIMVFTTIGLFLLIIPGLYLSVAYLLTVPLIVEKNMGPWRAMESSRKAITHHWFKVFLTYLIMGIIYIISIIPLGIGLIWTLPMMVNVSGILYRIMFGVEEARQGESR